MKDNRMAKRYLTIILSILCILDIHAQKLNVESFVVKTNDITARTQPRQDINGNDCALIKVQIAALDAVFSGTVVGNVLYNTSEYFVYMSHGSKRLTVKLEGYLPLEVNFDEYGIKALESKTTYVLTISGVSGARQLEAPKIKTGWIILESEPSGASVYINNEFVGNTPLNNYKQTYGTYQYRLESPNYHPATGTIELNAGRFEQRIALKPAFGAISVNSNVAGAKILLDGKPTGKNSPATLTEISSGSHIITLQLDKYAPQQQNVIVEDGQTANVSMLLNARFARVTINSIEGAEIYSNGKLIGHSHLSEDMMEGYYDLEVRMDHHKSVTKQIQVIAGQTQNITLNPIPKYGSLDIVSTPHDGNITIDGKFYGKTPLTIDQLLEGEHNVIISLDGYTSETWKLSISENQTSSIYVEFKKNVIPEMAVEELKKKIQELQNNSKELSDFIDSHKKAANEGNAVAQCYLGHMYYYGYGVTEDNAEAAIWYRKAAEQGNATAQCKLGYMYENGYEVAKDYGEAVKWYRKAAEQGYAPAQSGMGFMYYKGYGVSKDNGEAVKWFRKAAEQGYAPAQSGMGFMYYKGYGVSKDNGEAVKWFRKAAEQGYAAGQSWLGLMYYEGYGVSKDNGEAVMWYGKAAEQGDAAAQNNLGRMYEYGDGIAKDYGEAVRWYRKAAEQGFAAGQFNMGRMYEYGDGIAKDYGEAVRWYRKAAEQGFAAGQFNMGRMYEYGKGIAKDYGEAVRWYRKAAEQGYARAKEKMEQLGMFIH